MKMKITKKQEEIINKAVNEIEERIVKREELIDRASKITSDEVNASLLKRLNNKLSVGEKEITVLRGRNWKGQKVNLLKYKQEIENELKN